MPEVTLHPELDLFVDEGAPATPRFAEERLVVGDNSLESGYGVCRIWLRFDLSSVPAGSTVNSALLTLKNYFQNHTNYATPVMVEIAKSSNIGWDSTMTWNTAPNASVAGTPTDSVDIGFDIVEYGHLLTFDVAADVVAELPAEKVAWRIKHEDESEPEYADFYDSIRDPGNTYSRLVIDYEEGAGGLAAARSMHNFRQRR